MPDGFYGPDHAAFRGVVREFVDRSVAPHLLRWEEARNIDRDVWLEAGAHGILGTGIDADHGGAGVNDFRYRCIVMEELARVGATSLSSALALNDDIATPYLMRLGTDEQKDRWLPELAAGRAIAAIAMTEPGTGSDLRGVTTTAKPDDRGWVINGTKMFITNGANCDFVIVVARTGDGRSQSALTLFIVEDGTPGFTHGKRLEKLGQHAVDTAELIFDNVHVDASAVLGGVGNGLANLAANLPVERLSIAVLATSSARSALDWTIPYAKQREAFGKRLIDLQNTRFRLAEMTTEVDVTETFLREQVLRLNADDLDAVSAAKAKWWATEMQLRVVSGCLQIFGGYGYMTESPIARAFADARVQTIYGGTTEIMKEIIGRSLAYDDSGTTP